MSRSVLQLVRARLVVLLLSVLLLVLAIIYATALASLRPSSPGKQIGISEVLRRADAKALTSVTLLSEDNRVKGVSTLDPPVFWASVPSQLLPGLTDRLVEAGATVTVDDQFGKATVRFVAQFLLPIIILVVLLTLFFQLVRTGGNGGGEILRFGRTGDRRRKPAKPVAFSDVGGMADAVTEMREVGTFLTDPSAYQAIGAEAPRGVLLMGPPGCGKTLLARALASETDVPFFYLSGAEFVESLVGVGAARVRDLFAQARASAPAIVFIDELDAVGRRRGTGLGMGNDEREQTLNQLLVEMDGFDTFSEIVVVGATNRADILDPALIRPGRFDRRIQVFEPDLEGRRQILQIHANRRKMSGAADLELVAHETPGLSGADLAAILNESALLAVRAAKREIEQPELEEALERVLLGPARHARISADERRRAAFHEAGHAVVARAVGLAVTVQKVSIVARGTSIGHHAAMPTGDHVLWGTQTLLDQLTVTMGGVAAESIVFGDVSTASETDIAKATTLARRLVCLYGMSDRIGRVRVGSPEEEVFIGLDLVQGQTSPALMEEVDHEIRRVIGEAEQEAIRRLRTHRKALDGLAARLEEVESMRGDELDEVLKSVRAAATRAAATPKTGNGRRSPGKVGAGRN